MAKILAKDPKDMTEMEKVIWKVEIQKLCEDTDEKMADRKLKMKIEREGIKNFIQDSRQVISTYNDAVDRIGNVAKVRNPKNQMKTSNSDKNLSPLKT